MVVEHSGDHANMGHKVSGINEIESLIKRATDLNLGFLAMQGEAIKNQILCIHLSTD
jgi:hypothetical protein